MSINHFYHLYVDGLWEDLFRNHIESVISSGLVREIENITLGVVGSQGEKAKCIAILDSYDIPYKICSYTQDGWEQETLRYLYLASLDSDGVSLYAHSKGSSSLEVIQHIWRNIMTHMTITHWSECVNLLNTYDTVGAFYVKSDFSHNPFYAGNFWWAKNEYLRTLGNPPNNNRWEAETWLLKDQTNAYDIKNQSSKPIQIYNGWLNNECGVCNA